MGNIRQSISNMLFLLKPYWKYGKFYFITTLVMASIISPALSVANVLFTQTIVDAIALGTAYKNIIVIIFRYLIILLSVTLIQSGYNLLYQEQKNIQIQQRLKQDIYLNAVKTDYKYFDNPKFYDNYTWAINEYIAKANEAFRMLSGIIQSISILISMGSLIMILGPWLIVFTIIEMFCVVLCQIHTDKWSIKKRETIVPLDRKLDYVHRVFYQKEYASDIRTTNIRVFLFELYHSNIKQKIEVIRKYAQKIFIWICTKNTIGIIYNASVISYISYGLVVSKKIVGIGKFTSLLSANNQFMNSLNGIFKLFTVANNLSMYANKIKDFFETESSIETTDIDGRSCSDSPFSIKINNLNFSYDHSNFALKNINLHINPGNKVAIVGVNGSGKTTLLKLLLRLYDPDSGEIYYNQLSAREYNVRSLRSRIGVAFQSTNVYAASLAQNLQIYDEVSEIKLEKIIDDIGLTDVLNKFKGSINSELTKEFDKEGIILSTGEAQKLGVARIMLKDFGLLLLDEPSATLDPISEYELTQSLFNEANKTTTIIVAHRLAMVRDADYIYVMNQGSIVEEGTHMELMNQKGIYFDMFTKQSETFVK